MGTTWSAKLRPPFASVAAYATFASDPTVLHTALVARLAALEAIFSTWRPDSALSRFNASPSTDWHPVPAELARAVLLARDISDRTGGAFDITVAPLVALWGFGPHARAGPPPDASALAAARARVDYRRLAARLTPTAALRKTDPALTVDLSSLAKGFAVDELSALLAAAGAPHHLVQIGGDLRVAGPAWRIAIEDPRPPSASDAPPRPPTRVLTLADTALSTSGQSRNTLVHAGRRYGHLLDPRTGAPAAPDLGSASVLAPTCAASSALATALFVLGPVDALAFATREHVPLLLLQPTANELRALPSPSFPAPDAAPR
jgi:thiamine biosynthesis lipoprotein